MISYDKYIVNIVLLKNIWSFWKLLCRLKWLESQITYWTMNKAITMIAIKLWATLAAQMIENLLKKVEVMKSDLWKFLRAFLKASLLQTKREAQILTSQTLHNVLNFGWFYTANNWKIFFFHIKDVWKLNSERFPETYQEFYITLKLSSLKL